MTCPSSAYLFFLFKTPKSKQRTQSGEMAGDITGRNPPTDVDVDVRAILDDSVLWNNENEPKMVKQCGIFDQHVLVRCTSGDKKNGSLFDIRKEKSSRPQAVVPKLIHFDMCNETFLFPQKTPKTPAAHKKKPLSAWVPPSPFTPMPPYDDMNTPDLKVRRLSQTFARLLKVQC